MNMAYSGLVYTEQTAYRLDDLNANEIYRGCRVIMLYLDDIPHIEIGVELLVPCPLAQLLDAHLGCRQLLRHGATLLYNCLPYGHSCPAIHLISLIFRVHRVVA